MIKTEIFIENYPLDLTQDISAEFTYTIDDIKDFAARNTSFSKTIVLPGNANNNKLFGHIFEFGSSNMYSGSSANVGYNFNASKSASCIILVDRIQIFKGVIRLLEIIIDNNNIEYECAVFGELGGLVSAIGNKKIEELDFSAYNHAWTYGNISDSWSNLGTNNSGAIGSGYYYPLIDYGKVSNDKIGFDFRTFRPALYVKQYIDKLLTSAGYTYTCDFFNTDRFKGLIIPNNQIQLSAYTNTAFKGVPTVKSYNVAESVYEVEITGITTLGNFTANITNDIYTYNSTVPFDGDVTVVVNGQIINALNAYVRVYKNATIIGQQYIDTGGAGGFFSANIFASLVNFTNGDTFKVTLENDLTAFNVNVTASSLVTIMTVSSQLIPINYGETIDLNASIPKGVLQKDFFASIVKMFNLYVVEDSNKSKHINITPFIDFYTGVTLDWTDKLDRSKPLHLKPMSELNAKYYSFKYKSDSDYYNDNYKKKYNQSIGDFIYDSEYEFAEDTKSIEVIFSGTSLYQYVGTDKVYPAIYKLSNNNTAEDKMDSVIRILYAKKITGVSTWAIKDGTTSLMTFSDYGYAGHVDDPSNPTFDLSFGAPAEINFSTISYTSNNLFNLYWSEYIAEITDKDSKLMTANFRLTDMDIFNLDFAKFIQIDNTLWRLNKVYDYNPMVDDTTKVDLLKVIEITY